MWMSLNVHCKNIYISMDILWRVFSILTERVPYTFVSVNHRNNEAWAHVAIFLTVYFTLRKTCQKISVDIRIFYSVFLIPMPGVVHRFPAKTRRRSAFGLHPGDRVRQQFCDARSEIVSFRRLPEVQRLVDGTRGLPSAAQRVLQQVVRGSHFAAEAGVLSDAGRREVCRTTTAEDRRSAARVESSRQD